LTLYSCYGVRMSKTTEWEMIRGTHDRYEVSRFGVIRKLGKPLWTDPDTGQVHRNAPPRLIRPQRSFSGYLRAEFWVNGVRDRRALADVVGEAFHGVIDAGRSHYVLIDERIDDETGQQNYSADNIRAVKRPVNAAALRAAEKHGITL
jgi:hypothetical protein